MPNPSQLRVFVDADVLYRATSASHPATASLAVLHLGQATVLEVVTSRYTLGEALRNLNRRSPALAQDLLDLARQSVEVVDAPSAAIVSRFVGQAHPKDVPNLAGAVMANAHMLLTFNVRDYFPPPGVLRVLTPGELLIQARTALVGLTV